MGIASFILIKISQAEEVTQLAELYYKAGWSGLIFALFVVVILGALRLMNADSLPDDLVD